MEDLDLSEQPWADTRVEVTPLAPMSGSLGARQPAEDSTTAAGGLGHGERSAPAGNESVTTPEATVVTAGPSGAKAGIASEAPKSGSTEPMAPSELKAPPEASWGVVGPFVWPQSPPMVSPAVAEEEDEVEEIVRAEPQTQSVLILRRHGDEVVVVEEEDTPRR